LATKQKFRRSIIHYSSVVDIHMVLDELLEELQQKADLKEVKSMLEQKKLEVEERYNTHF